MNSLHVIALIFFVLGTGIFIGRSASVTYPHHVAAAERVCANNGGWKKLISDGSLKLSVDCNDGLEKSKFTVESVGIVPVN